MLDAVRVRPTPCRRPGTPPWYGVEAAAPNQRGPFGAATGSAGESDGARSPVISKADAALLPTAVPTLDRGAAVTLPIAAPAASLAAVAGGRP